MARRRAIVSALQQKRVGENNQELVNIMLKMELQMMMMISSSQIYIDNGKVDEREEREETNRRRRLQREKTRRREEKGEKARQRGRSENNEEAASARREEEIEVEEGGCSHCRASVATECVYLCQKGHLHRDLPGEVNQEHPSLHWQNFHHLQTLRGDKSCNICLLEKPNLIWIWLQGCHHCGRRGESECKSAFMRILRAGGGLVDRGGQQAGKGSSRATSAANISSWNLS